MAEPTLTSDYPVTQAPTSATGSKSAASWPAIIAGAVVASAVTLILLALGSGLGFAAVSPWPNKGVSGMTFAVTVAVWLILTQWISAGIGGYLAGRLRTRWVGTHAHEVFFRDTAHGLTSWALATLVLATTVAMSALSGLGALGHGAAAVVAGGAKGAMSTADSPWTAYGIDRLFRPAEGATNNTAAAPGADSKPEVAHIIANLGASGSVSDADRAYLAQLIAARTGIPPEDAKKRVDDFVSSVMDAEAKAKAAADQARKDAAQASIYLALSLLVGAFIASISAVLGGRLRDEHL